MGRGEWGVGRVGEGVRPAPRELRSRAAAAGAKTSRPWWWNVGAGPPTGTRWRGRSSRIIEEKDQQTGVGGEEKRVPTRRRGATARSRCVPTLDPQIASVLYRPSRGIVLHEAAKRSCPPRRSPGATDEFDVDLGGAGVRYGSTAAPRQTEEMARSAEVVRNVIKLEVARRHPPLSRTRSSTAPLESPFTLSASRCEAARDP